MKKLVVATAIVSLLYVIASVDAIVINPAPSGEESLYAVYNTVYETSYTSNSDLEGLLVENDSEWYTIDGSLTVTPVAMWAGYSQYFGYYTDLGSGTDRTLLASQEGYYGGYLSSDPITVSLSDNFGWYLDSNDSSAPPPWYSDTSLNVDSFDHLAALRGTDGTYLLAWEDLQGGGDSDYNDFVVKAGGVGAVPEPASLLLVASVLGIAGIGYGKKKFRTI